MSAGLQLLFAVLNLIVLAATAAVVAWYTLETKRLREKAAEQVDLARQQFDEVRAQREAAEDALAIERERIEIERHAARRQLEADLDPLDPILSYGKPEPYIAFEGDHEGIHMKVENTGAAVSDVSISWEGGHAKFDGPPNWPGTLLPGRSTGLSMWIDGAGPIDPTGQIVRLDYTLATGHRRWGRFQFANGRLAKIEGGGELQIFV